MKQPLDRFAVDVGDQISWPETGIKGRRSSVDLHHQVVHSVEVGVAEVDANGAYRKPEPSRATPDNYWRIKSVDERRNVAAR